MIASMTAYARQQHTQDNNRWSWELRSVNHRYLDVSFKLPDQFRALEGGLRERIAQQLKRGKLECRLSWQSQPLTGHQVDAAALQQLQNMLTQVGQQLPQLAAPTTLEVLSWPGVMDEPEHDTDALHAALLESFVQTLNDLNHSRQREGEALAQLLEQRLQGVEQQVNSVRQAMPEIREQLTKKMQDKLAPLLEKFDADSGRLEQELALQLQRLDVDEELDRLDTHVAEVRRTLGKGGACGRRLDFMMQELNREANTLASKAAASSVTQSGIELKVLIEQMREQIQNIE